MHAMEIKTDERFRERQSGEGASGLLEKRWSDFSFAEEGDGMILVDIGGSLP